jgi:4-amino-4-deoxy-L-arabinose transferase-like glycosyltransferase
LFLAPSTAMVRAFTGLGEEASVSWMWIRLWSGLCGALTVLPVFGMARRVIGLESADATGASPRLATAAGLVAGLLVTASTLYNEVTHVYISDVPAAFFAALCLYCVARLTERESRRDYIGAGIASGLAAASKYPAGVVAIGIVAVWIAWRVAAARGQERSPAVRHGLLLAGAVSLATFLLVMPSFLVHARAAFAGEGRDVLFGVRQYADAGWIGVEKDKQRELVRRARPGRPSAPARSCSASAASSRSPRRPAGRWLLLAVFPAGLRAAAGVDGDGGEAQPAAVLPPVAALLGVGVAAVGSRLAARWPRFGWIVATGVGALALAVPMVAVVAQDLSLVPSGHPRGPGGLGARARAGGCGNRQGVLHAAPRRRVRRAADALRGPRRAR